MRGGLLPSHAHAPLPPQTQALPRGSLSHTNNMSHRGGRRSAVGMGTLTDKQVRRWGEVRERGCGRRGKGGEREGEEEREEGEYSVCVGGGWRGRKGGTEEAGGDRNFPT